MSTELLEVPLAKIKAHPSNPRRDVGDVAELAESIRSVGVMEPLVVAPTGEGKTPWLLIAGHRRHAGAAAAGLATVPCITRPDLDTPARQLEAMLVENLHRTDLSPVEEGDAYQQLLTFPGYTQAKVAKATGRALSTVRERLKLSKVPETARARIHDGTITVADALVFAEFADDPKALKELEKAVGTANWRWVTGDLKRAREDAAAAKLARAAVADEGVEIIERPDGFPSHSVERPVGLGYGQLGVALEDHVSCPHHAAIEPSSDVVTYVCTDPSVHGVDAAPTAVEGKRSKAELAAEAQRLAAVERRAQDVATAAGIRADFLRERLGGFIRLDELQRQAIRRSLLTLATQVYIEVDTEPWTHWLDLDQHRDGPAPEHAREAELRTAIADLDPDLCLLAMLAAVHEPDLAGFRAEIAPPGYFSDSAWFPLLQALGYELTAFEVELTTAPQVDASDVDKDEG